MEPKEPTAAELAQMAVDANLDTQAAITHAKARIRHYKRIKAAEMEPGMCPRCGANTMWPDDGANALSRANPEKYICSPCGVDEALLSYFWKEVLGK